MSDIRKEATSIHHDLHHFIDEKVYFVVADLDTPEEPEKQQFDSRLAADLYAGFLSCRNNPRLFAELLRVMGEERDWLFREL